MKTRKSQNVDNIAYRFLLKPGPVHIELFSRWFGCGRFLWNHMLADKRDHYKIMGFDIHNEVTDYKDYYLFLKDIDSLVLANVKLNLDKAYEAFFKGNALYPTFKCKHSKQSFTTNCSCKKNPNLTYDTDTHMLKLPKIKEPVRVHQHRKIRSGGTLKSATISLEPDSRYYVSLLYEYPKTIHTSRINEAKAIGLDMSMEHFYVDSDGDVADMPHYYRLMEAKLAKEQAKLSMMIKGSNNYKKQKLRIAKLHAKTKHQRSDMLHKLAYGLVNTYDIICIEDLNMKAMSQGLSLGKSVHDSGWGMFTRMLEYKCRKFGKILIKVDKYYPSSKTCHCCGYNNNNLALSDRVYECPKCGNFIDRDWQAALNILDEGLRIYHSDISSAA